MRLKSTSENGREERKNSSVDQREIEIDCNSCGKVHPTLLYNHITEFSSFVNQKGTEATLAANFRLGNY